MAAALSAVVVGADRLGNIPDLLKGHNISITHHISGRDPSHQKKTLQLPSGTPLVILLTDLLAPNVMTPFRPAAQRGGIRAVACRPSVRPLPPPLQPSGRRSIPSPHARPPGTHALRPRPPPRPP